MKKLCVVMMLAMFAVLPVTADEPSAPSPDEGREILDEKTLLAELRALIEGDEWGSAHDLFKGYMENLTETAALSWGNLRSDLEDAASHNITEWQLKGKAKSAQKLGLYDLAMEYFDVLHSIATNNHQTHYARSDKALCAWDAARAAVRRGDFKAASGYLDIMRDFGEEWISEEGAKNGDLLRNLMARPESVPDRIAFANSFWLEMPPALERGLVEARQIFIDTLALDPTPEERLELYQLIQQQSFAIPDTPAAIENTERICAEFPEQADVCDRALFALAQHHTAQKEPRRAIETLESILALHPQSPMTGTVHLGLSEALTTVGDEEGMLRNLELAAELSAEATLRGIMDTSDTRQTALVRLGKHYQDKGDYARALEYFRSWEPRSWCGNCHDQFEYERDLYIAQCLVSLGHVDEALTEHLMPQLGEVEVLLYTNAKIPELAVRLHEDKGDLDGLIRVLQPLAASEQNATARTALGLAQIRVERRDGKIASLVARLRHSGRSMPSVQEPRDNWEAPAAARALSEFNGKEYPALREAYDAIIGKDNSDEVRGRRMWLLYAMALSRNPDARAFLVALLNSTETEETLYTIGVRSDVIRYLVSLAEEGHPKQ